MVSVEPNKQDVRQAPAGYLLGRPLRCSLECPRQRPLLR